VSPAGSSNAPEARARTRIDEALAEAGWTLQDRDDMNLTAASDIAVREFKLDRDHGYVDYMLFLDRHAVGVCEAKPAGTPLIGVEHQVKKYVAGIPPALAAPYTPLPFAYLSTGEETLRDDGLSYQDYLEQLTFLLLCRNRFMAQRRDTPSGLLKANS
jgi:type I restriction enzyme R subunit